MWCVLATKVGREELIQQMCKRHLNKKIYSRCMFPLCEQREHYRGTWHTKLEKVFPGYLFFDTGDPDELSRQLRKEKIMAQNDKLFVLTPEDVQCLLFFGRTGVFPMSQGIIVNGRVIILSGPLVGEESRIRKVDRHKRRVWMQMELFRKPHMVVVGLEISQKIEQEEESSLYILGDEVGRNNIRRALEKKKLPKENVKERSIHGKVAMECCESPDGTRGIYNMNTTSQFLTDTGRGVS